MKYLFLYIIFSVFSLHALASADTLSVYFALNVAQLNETAKKTLDSFVYNDIIFAGKKVGIIGYADYLGTEKTNIALSEKRAHNVMSYLLSLGISSEDIETVTGKGEIPRVVENGSNGYRTDRRVDIIPGGFNKDTIVSIRQDTIVKKSKSIIDLSSVKENETIRLEKMFFLPGRHFLREESMVELLKLYKIMKDNPSLKISIEGHICCLLKNTSDGYDYDTEEFRLSVNRAKYIYEYLLYKGIGKERMQYKGFGKTRPLVDPEITTDDEDLNRRVEIRIISK